MLYGFIHRHIGRVAVCEDYGIPVRFGELNTIRTGFTVVTPCLLLTMTGSILSTAHTVFRSFRVIVRVDNTGAELNEEDRSTNGNNRSGSGCPLLNRHRNIIRSVIFRFRKIGRSDRQSLLGQPIKQKVRSGFQPILVAFKLPNGIINPGHRQRYFNRFHDTVTLLMA
nr:MAG TPA: hypothetical protein [Caudoviricetes sp.]